MRLVIGFAGGAIFFVVSLAILYVWRVFISPKLVSCGRGLLESFATMRQQHHAFRGSASANSGWGIFSGVYFPDPIPHFVKRRMVCRNGFGSKWATRKILTSSPTDKDLRILGDWAHHFQDEVILALILRMGRDMDADFGTWLTKKVISWWLYLQEIDYPYIYHVKAVKDALPRAKKLFNDFYRQLMDDDVDLAPAEMTSFIAYSDDEQLKFRLGWKWMPTASDKELEMIGNNVPGLLSTVSAILKIRPLPLEEREPSVIEVGA